MPYLDDQYHYTAEEVETILFADPDSSFDAIDHRTDVLRAFDWLCLEFPTWARLVKAILAGYTLAELAEKRQTSPEFIDAELLCAYGHMARWLNRHD